jgi:hypothetical protein
MTDTRFTPLSREELARARRAAVGTPSPQAGIPMGIRYKSAPTGRAPRPAAAKDTTLRPGWALTLTATPSAALTRLATAAVPAARPHGIAVPRQRTSPASEAGLRVLRRTDAYACLRCGARYTRPNRHNCGRLTPVTVTVTARTSTPEPGALGSYDTFGCWTCQSTGPGNAGHPCGPLTPVTVTITTRTPATVTAAAGTGPRRRGAARHRPDPAVDDTIRQLHGQGLNDAQIAARTGLTRGQVHYIRGKRLALATQFGPRGHRKTVTAASTAGGRP